MSQVMVPYRVKSDRAEENADFVRNVFDELRRDRPHGLRYGSFRLEDGFTFVHLAEIDTDDGSNPLTETDAFKAFQKDLKDRCEEMPVATELHEIGTFSLFGG